MSKFVCSRCFGSESQGCAASERDLIYTQTIPRGVFRGTYGCFSTVENHILQVDQTNLVQEMIGFFITCDSCYGAGLLGRAVQMQLFPFRRLFLLDMSNFFLVTRWYTLHAATGECQPDVILCKGCKSEVANGTSFLFRDGDRLGVFSSVHGCVNVDYRNQNAASGNVVAPATCANCGHRCGCRILAVHNAVDNIQAGDYYIDMKTVWMQWKDAGPDHRAFLRKGTDPFTPLLDA